MKKQNILSAVLTAASICMLTGFTMTAAADGDIWSSTTSRNADGNICIDFEEVQVLLPADWSGKCKMNTSETCVSFYQIKSRDLWTQDLGYPNGGWMFSINCSQNYDYLDNPSYMTIGTGEEGIYYATFPTDVQGYMNDEETAAEFTDMSADMDWIRQNITLTASGDITAIDGDYIFPQSSSAYLGEADLAGLNADQVQMAINEIYARHHRRFVIQSIQDYFDSKSWYDGYIEADDFDVSVMNQYEGANIDLMVKCLNNKTASGQNITILESATKDAYGMIIESGSGYFRVRMEDGSVVQFWYDASKLDSMGLTSDMIQVGAITSLIYDTETYEALNILIW